MLLILFPKCHTRLFCYICSNINVSFDKNIMFKFKNLIFSLTLASFLGGCGPIPSTVMEKDYVDYVNPYIGNISHLLVPT